MEVDSNEDATLIINQIFTPGWSMISDQTKDVQVPEAFQNIIQSYNIKMGTKKIIFRYRPKEFYYGMSLSILGLLSLLIITLKIYYVKKI